MEVGKKYFEQLIDKMKEEKGVNPRRRARPPTTSRSWPTSSRPSTRPRSARTSPPTRRSSSWARSRRSSARWDNPRANVYRRDNDIPYSWGTAVNVQIDGVRQHGRRLRHRRCLHPQPRHRREEAHGRVPDQRAGRGRRRRRPHPDAHRPDGREVPRGLSSSSRRSARSLEKHYRDMQDMEFTIENGKLYMLQTRNGKRTAAAALKIACDLVDEGMIDEKKAVLMIEPEHARHPAPSRSSTPKVLKEATPYRQGRCAASPGAACGKIVFYRRGRQGVERARREGRARPSRDLSRGHRGHEGLAGHPDRPRRHDLPRGRRRARHGHLLRLRLRRHQHGRGEQEVRARRQGLPRGRLASPSTAPPATSTTDVIPTVDASIAGEFGRIMGWADKYRTLQVRTNADTPRDAAQARELRRRGHRPLPHRAYVLRG